MKPKKYSISDVIRELSGMLKTVCKNVHFESQRTANYEKEDEIIFLDVISSIDDKYLCKDCIIDISIIVKNKEGGVTPVLTLQRMLTDLEAMFPIVGKSFVAWDPETALSGNDDAGNSVWSTKAKLRIKAIPE